MAETDHLGQVMFFRLGCVKQLLLNTLRLLYYSSIVH